MFSQVINIKADQLRSKVSLFCKNILLNKFIQMKANLPASGSSRGLDAVDKSRKAATALLELKFPDRDVNNASLQMTTPLEIKYHNFSQKDMIKKSKDLKGHEV